MSDARDDIRNLFRDHGLTTRYQEFGERPAPPRREPPRQQEPEPAPMATPPPPATETAKRQPPKLDLVRRTDDSAEATAPENPLASLFAKMAEHKPASAAPPLRDEVAPETLPLASLFARLEAAAKQR